MTEKVNEEENADLNTKVSEPPSIETGRTGYNKIFNFINVFSTVIVAVATTILVYVNYQNIDEAKKMREATEKLADSTIKQIDEAKQMRIQATRQTDTIIEQFKIRSYPTFIVIMDPLSIKEDKDKKLDRVLNNYIIYNKGEISAFDVRCLLVYVYTKDSKRSYNISKAHYYEGKEGIKAIDIKQKIAAGAGLKVTSEFQLLSPKDYGQLKNMLLIIRFQVPYDPKTKYEILAYSLEDSPPKKDLKTWQVMSTNDTNDLCKAFISDKAWQKETEVKDFLSEFRLPPKITKLP